jgi:hypothetical protein
VAQFFLAYAAYSAPVVGVLHGLNALAIFAVALLAARRAARPDAKLDLHRRAAKGGPGGHTDEQIR